ncbi:hypothetical protein AA14337_3137 [Acetobacter malorum DSM 14337]|uniref:Uncharacterized protein n=1 Tax=Acetobacter malorum DSM 14337 TaxID=1307910 RepID=A0ABQ0PZV6_9PROT|nr:hypothetical protein [Acetobacter malorum]KXV05714.1 hypothetical protein AD930_11320 [Acetobacter malorum]GBQ85684.1 hypothetical protein AA14337_3137 [Acetobacter malorum DSM 14337]
MTQPAKATESGPEDLPAKIREARNILEAAGWKVTPPPPQGQQFGCFCEIETMQPGSKPDGCVIDDGLRENCVYAGRIDRKESCSFWRAWSEESIRKMWEGIEGGQPAT